MDYKLIATKRHEKTRKSSIIVAFLCLFVAIRSGIGNNPVRIQNIVCIRWAISRNNPVEDDFDGFLN